MDQKLEALGRVPLFAGLSREDLVRVGALCDTVDLPEGKVVATQGSTADAFYVIEKGSVAIDQDGQRVAELGSGEFFGEMAMLGRIPRTATATCASPCTLLVIGHRELNTLMADHPSVQGEILRALAARFARMVSSG